MSAIRERSVLCVIDLPKKLTNRSNFLAHFSKFGEVKSAKINEIRQTGIIQFATHFDAQSAKNQGVNFEGKSLKILWSDSATSDPRARENTDYDSSLNEDLWGTDDKESFGVESANVSNKEERKQSAREMIKQHLMKPVKLGIKNRLGNAAQMGEDKKEVSALLKPNPQARVNKVTSKLLTVKKTTVNTTVKRKIFRKPGDTLNSSASINKKLSSSSNQKTFVLKELPIKPNQTSEKLKLLKKKLSQLDDIDKSIRMSIVHDSNIKTAVAIKGTCPDMCPERERILRQCSLAIATYEMIPGTNEMDENRAVKEYTRSSADQEVPLPHDLRPEPVLSMTMNYLITNIITKVDQTGENKAVWYSFCWNRLRSIRKDIILQQLCNIETVTIVEQCARFHICCYDHMWGAEIGGFDDNINTKNLIDCLQTLKHLYEDLSERGISCPNEPEFYLYLILLKLKSGDVMWEYQQYSLNIRSSPEVQFGIKAYMAFKNNMYSRYFSLVKKGTYLTACLMQRYFDTVRTQALKSMLRAYCLPNKNTGLLASFIVSCLKFDSQKNALRFCEQEEVEVKVDTTDNVADEYVSTSSFLIHEKRLPIANAVFGECNPLPVYTPHQVHNSFDENGTYIKSSDVETIVVADDDSSKEVAYNEGDTLDINLPNELQQDSFKFSLSPTKVPGNVFGSNIFSKDLTLDKNQDLELKGMSNIDRAPFQTDMEVCNVINEQELSIPFKIKPEKQQENIVSPFTLPINFMNHTKNPVKHNQTLDKSQFNFLKPIHPTSFLPSTEKPLLAIEKENLHTLNKTHVFSAHQSFEQSDSHDAENNKKSELPFSFYNNHNTKPQVDTTTIHKEKLSPTLKFPQSLENESSRQEVQNETQNDCIVLTEVDIKQSAEEQLFKTPKVNLNANKLSKENESKSLFHGNLLIKEVEQKKAKLEEHKEIEKIRKQNDMAMKKKKYNKLLGRCAFKVVSARKCALRWRNKIERLKKSRADFPLLIQLSVRDHVLKWGSMNSIPTNSIFLRARHNRQTKRIVSQLLSLGITDCCKYIGSDLAESLAKSAIKTMQRGSVKPVYWKLAISVPWADNQSSELSVFNQLMKRWCKESFYKHQKCLLGSVEQVMTSLEVLVNMSIHLSDTMESSQNLQGTDALIFVVLNGTESEKRCIQRLRTLVTDQVKSCGFSVSVMNVGGNKLDRILKIELEELHEQNIVAHWKIFTWSDSHSINGSLHFLADQVQLVQDVSVSSLQLLIRQISEDFFDALSCSQYNSEELRKTLKRPNNIIYLYNACLNKVKVLLLNVKLEKCVAEDFLALIPTSESGGPELMCGKPCDVIYLNQINKTISSLKLPEFLHWPPRTVSHLVKMLKGYCNQVYDLSIFPQILRMLCLPEESDIQEHLDHISWLNIIEVWAQVNVQQVFSKIPKNKTLLVVFNKNDVQKVTKIHWWLKDPVVAGQK